MFEASGYVTSHRRADMNILTEIDKAYIAGFFDGEGCVSILKNQGKENRTPRYILTAVITQKDKRSLDELQDLTDIGSVYFGNKITGIYAWTMCNSHARDFLSVILPYLKYKKDQAVLGIEFFEKFNKHTRVYQQGRHAVGGSMPTPQYIVDQKEHYRQLLHDLKNTKAGRPASKKIIPSNIIYNE
jgi:hypothetical protein